VLKIPLKMKHIFLGRPKKVGSPYGKVESKNPVGQKFQGFCDIFNGF